MLVWFPSIPRRKPGFRHLPASPANRDGSPRELSASASARGARCRRMSGSSRRYARTGGRPRSRVPDRPDRHGSARVDRYLLMRADGTVTETPEPVWDYG